jgi:transcriptional regulator with XRE-family HTH domain
MAKTKGTFSPITLEATRLLGARIRLARRERRWTTQDLAERIGVSRPTLLRIEKGDPTASLGATFEAATILGIPLFDEDASRRRFEASRVEDRLAVLPKTVRKRARIDNDF